MLEWLADNAMTLVAGAGVVGLAALSIHNLRPRKKKKGEDDSADSGCGSGCSGNCACCIYHKQ